MKMEKIAIKKDDVMKSNGLEIATELGKTIVASKFYYLRTKSRYDNSLNSQGVPYYIPVMFLFAIYTLLQVVCWTTDLLKYILSHVCYRKYVRICSKLQV